MNSSTTKLTVAIMLAAISSLVIAGVGTAAVRADINNPGRVDIDNSNVRIFIGAGKDGAPGKDGAQGEKGDTGEKGDKGDTGETGDMGNQGPPGVNGTNGRDGINGTNGRDGVNGTNGVDGRDGVNGTNGRDGTNGTDGQNGVDGLNGKDGMNATATVSIFAPNGTETTCTLTPPNVMTCTPVNGTVPIPPVVCTPPEVNVNGTCTAPIIPPIDNNTGNDTNDNDTNGNGTAPVGYDLPTGLQKILGF